jgi:phage replication O-like protein O
MKKDVKNSLYLPTNIFDQLPLLQLAGSDYRLLLVIIRKTFGWHKEDDWISYTQFEKLTGLTRKSVAKSLKRLVALNIVLVTKSTPLVTESTLPRYKLNINSESWVVTKRKLVTKRSPTSIHLFPQLVTKRKHTKDTITKDTITKDTREKLFKDFWELYPNKKGKAKAKAIYQKHATHHQDILKGLQAYLSYWKAKGTEMQYIPHPATWLNQERWTDELNDSKPVATTARKTDLPPNWEPVAEVERNPQAMLEGRKKFDAWRRSKLIVKTL